MNKIGVRVAGCLTALAMFGASGCSSTSGGSSDPCQSFVGTAQQALSACSRPAVPTSCLTVCQNHVADCNAHDMELLGIAQNCVESANNSCLSNSQPAAAFKACLGADPDSAEYGMQYSSGCQQAIRYVLECWQSVN